MTLSDLYGILPKSGFQGSANRWKLQKNWKPKGIINDCHTTTTENVENS